MVIMLSMSGSREYSSLATVKICVLPFGKTIVSAPAPFAQPPVATSVLAAVIASTSVHALLTLMIAANAGV